MTPRQILTILIFGASIAICGLGVAFGIGVAVSPKLSAVAAVALQANLSPLALGALVSALFVLAAYGIVKLRHWYLWLASERELSKIYKLARNIELERGSEPAREFIKFRIGLLSEEAEKTRIIIPNEFDRSQKSLNFRR